MKPTVVFLLLAGACCLTLAANQLRGRVAWWSLLAATGAFMGWGGLGM